MLFFVKLSPSNVISHTLEGISVPHLLPDKVPARRWSPTLVTDGRTLAVVNVDFSIPVPLTIVLETLKNDFKDLSNSLYLIPTQETTLQQYLNFHLPVDHSIWTCGKGRRVVQSCFEPSSSIVWKDSSSSLMTEPTSWSSSKGRQYLTIMNTENIDLDSHWDEKKN